MSFFSMLPMPCSSCHRLFSMLQIPCPYCHRRFSVMSNLKRHTKQQHQDVFVFVCNVCGDKFNMRKKLRRHGKVGLQKRQSIFTDTDSPELHSTPYCQSTAPPTLHTSPTATALASIFLTNQMYRKVFALVLPFFLFLFFFLYLVELRAPENPFCAYSHTRTSNPPFRLSLCV